MDVAILFSGLNALILVALLYFYLRIAIRSRAAHALGMAFFAVLLLSTSVLTVYSYSAMSPFFGSEALPYLSAISILEFIGLAALLKITL
jgi:uncharacterized membrane protein